MCGTRKWQHEQYKTTPLETRLGSIWVHDWLSPNRPRRCLKSRSHVWPVMFPDALLNGCSEGSHWRIWPGWGVKCRYVGRQPAITFTNDNTMFCPIKRFKTWGKWRNIGDNHENRGRITSAKWPYLAFTWELGTQVNTRVRTLYKRWTHKNLQS